MDGAPRDEVLAIAELAAQITGMPMAAVNIMTADQQHTIATVGFDSDVCRRDDSMCAAVLSEKSPVVVPDASLDPRFRDNPFVTGQLGTVRFYASHRLVDRDGVVIGTLCVFDDEPRMLEEREARALGVLAERIVDVLELALREPTARGLQRPPEPLRRAREPRPQDPAHQHLDDAPADPGAARRARRRRRHRMADREGAQGLGPDGRDDRRHPRLRHDRGLGRARPRRPRRRRQPMCSPTCAASSTASR